MYCSLLFNSFVTHSIQRYTPNYQQNLHNSVFNTWNNGKLPPRFVVLCNVMQ